MVVKRRTSNNPAGRPRSAVATERIHKAVFGLLKDRGYRDLSMEAIAESAGVSRPALYRRYRSVGEAALGALQSVGSTVVPMPRSNDVIEDLRSYFISLVMVITEDSVIGRALRGTLATTLSDVTMKAHFARFIDLRRKPVAQRLLEWNTALGGAQLDAVMDSMFGPILYRLLIRQVGVTGPQIERIIDRALK